MQLDGMRQNRPMRSGPNGGRGLRSLAMVTRLLDEAGHRPRQPNTKDNSPDGMRGAAVPSGGDPQDQPHVAALLQGLVTLFQPHARGASLDLRLVLPEDLPQAHLPVSPAFEKSLRRFLGEVIAAGHGQVVDLQLNVLARAGAYWMLALSAVAKRGGGALHVLLPRVMFYLTEIASDAGGVPAQASLREKTSFAPSDRSAR